MLAREVYDKVFYPEHQAMSFECFRHKILIWKRKQICDTDTLKSGKAISIANEYMNNLGMVVEA